jgi:hypothetical protein
MSLPPEKINDRENPRINPRTNKAALVKDIHRRYGSHILISHRPLSCGYMAQLLFSVQYLNFTKVIFVSSKFCSFNSFYFFAGLPLRNLKKSILISKPKVGNVFPIGSKIISINLKKLGRWLTFQVRKLHHNRKILKTSSKLKQNSYQKKQKSES